MRLRTARTERHARVHCSSPDCPPDPIIPIPIPIPKPRRMEWSAIRSLLILVSAKLYTSLLYASTAPTSVSFSSEFNQLLDAVEEGDQSVVEASVLQQSCRSKFRGGIAIVNFVSTRHTARTSSCPVKPHQCARMSPAGQFSSYHQWHPGWTHLWKPHPTLTAMRSTQRATSPQAALISDQSTDGRPPSLSPLMVPTDWLVPTRGT